METERWKRIKNLAGYKVSDLGNIQKDGEKIKSIKHRPPECKRKNVYYPILNGKKSQDPYFIDLTVAQAFLGRPIDQQHKYIIHIDGNRLNDKLDNLKWGTNSERQKLYHKLGVWKQNSYFGLLNGKTVREIYVLAHTKGIELSEIAEKYKCSVTDVRAIKKGEKWGYITKNLIGEHEENRTDNEEITEYALRVLRTLKRTGKDVKRNLVNFTEEQKEKILNLTIKEGNEIGLPKRSLVVLKAKIRNGEALNGNTKNVKKLMNYLEKPDAV